MPDIPNSLLSFVELAIPPYALRGINENLSPIGQAANIERDINGGLHNLSAEGFQKYRGRIECTDFDSPGLGYVWPGMLLTMHAVSELSFEGDTDSAGFPRPPVPGSTREADGFTFFRPILEIMITDCGQGFREWEAEYSWFIEFEEV